MIVRIRYMPQHYTYRFETGTCWSSSFLLYSIVSERLRSCTHLYKNITDARDEFHEPSLEARFILGDIRILEAFCMITIFEYQRGKVEPLGSERLIERKAANAQHHSRNLSHLRLEWLCILDNVTNRNTSYPFRWTDHICIR